MRAYTLIEVLIVCALVGLTAGIAAPTVRTAVNSMAVEGAARDVAHTFALARLAALRHRGAEVRIDTLRLTMSAGGRTLHIAEIARAHGVRMRTTQSLVRYAATGLGTGVSNGSIIVWRGAAADTVVVSRLGRVRR